MSGHGHADQPGVRCYCGQHGSLYPAAERARQIGRLRAQRRGVWTDAKNLADHAASEARTFTPAEQARWVNLNEALDDLDRKLRALMDDAAANGYMAVRTIDGKRVDLPVDPDLIQTNGKPLYQHLADEAAEQLARPQPKPRRTRKPCTDCRYWLAGGRRWVYYSGGQTRRCGYCDELAALRARAKANQQPAPVRRKHGAYGNHPLRVLAFPLALIAVATLAVALTNASYGWLAYLSLASSLAGNYSHRYRRRS